MYKLFYYPRNASWAPHLVLKELGVDYELIFVDRKTNAHKAKEYMDLNPTGRIPTLVDGNLVIFESAAICLYLCDKYPQSHLAPQVGDPLRAEFLQWLFYLNATLQPELMIYFYPAKHTVDSNGTTAIIEAQEARITDIFALLDNRLGGKEFLVGDRLTACDFLLFTLSHWADEFKRPPLAFSNLAKYLRSLAKHSTIQQVCKTEGTDLSAYN
ncbi:MAG: glutathione S-transferase family protein [Gammaproteobacteria bacterium]|nr:MAG: glutathione S-transferase family protein [Gammaproteobacteria bacterium]